MEPATIDAKNSVAFAVAPLTSSAPDQQVWFAAEHVVDTPVTASDDGKGKRA